MTDIRVTCYNELQLDKAVKMAYDMLKADKAVNITIQPYQKPTTKKQLGFFWGAIAGAVKDFYYQKTGDVWSDQAVKDVFYKAASPRIKLKMLNGDINDYPLHISEMNREQMSGFIDKSLTLIEQASCFKDLVLHPSVRFCWVHNITPDDIRQVDTRAFPRKSPEYLQHLRGQCCLCCGQYGCEAHHIRETEDAGTARKAHDWETISLCPTCHRYYHTKGQGWFRKQIHWILKYMSLEDFCALNYNRWRNHL